MPYKFDPVTNIPQMFSNLILIDNANGKATWRITGYTHPDPTGYVLMIWDTDRNNIVNESPSGFSANLPYNDTTGEITINDNTVPYYVQYIAYDNGGSTVLYKSDIAVKRITGDTVGDIAALAVESEGFGFTLAKARQPLVDLFANLRAEGVLSLVGELHLNVFEAEAPNAVQLISTDVGVYTAGTRTHGTTGTTYASNAYYNYNRTPGVMGMTGTVNGLMMIYGNTRTAGANKQDIGATDAATGWLELISHWAGPLGYYSLGNTSTGAMNDVNTTGTLGPGIHIGSRNGANGFASFYNFSTSSSTTLTSRADMSGGAMPAVNVYEGAQNVSGTPGRHINTTVIGSALLKGPTTSEATSISSCLETFLQAWGVIPG
jgi:hypothetical protein